MKAANHRQGCLQNAVASSENKTPFAASEMYSGKCAHSSWKAFASETWEHHCCSSLHPKRWVLYLDIFAYVFLYSLESFIQVVLSFGKRQAIPGFLWEGKRRAVLWIETGYWLHLNSAMTFPLFKMGSWHFLLTSSARMKNKPKRWCLWRLVPRMAPESSEGIVPSIINSSSAINASKWNLSYYFFIPESCRGQCFCSCCNSKNCHDKSHHNVM